jgi:hypothetical protein
MRNDYQVHHPTQQSASQGGAKVETWACVNGIRYRVRSRQAPVPSSDSPSASPTTDPRAEPGEYKVGYGKPPKDTQFPKGQSGNPKGRPKGSKNLVTLVHEELGQLISVREDGRSRKVPAVAAIAKRMVNGGLAGNQRAIDQLLRIPGVLGTGDGMVSIPDSNREPPTAGDRAILERYNQRVIEEHKLSADDVGTHKVDDEGGSV